MSNGVYLPTTPFAFVKLSASLTSIKWFSLRFWSNIFWISVKTSLFAAFFRASSSRAATKLCYSSAKTSAKTSAEVRFFALIFFVIFYVVFADMFWCFIKCFTQKCFDENMQTTVFMLKITCTCCLHKASLCHQIVYIKFHMETKISKDFWLILH